MATTHYSVITGIATKHYQGTDLGEARRILREQPARLSPRLVAVHEDAPIESVILERVGVIAAAE